MRVVVQCPAKVNLFLAVGPRDSSGYHPVRTILQAVSLFDTLTIESAAVSSIRSDWPDLPAENTLSKALRLVTEVAEVPPLDIHLEKRIPWESGLGGGSSDAAALLRAVRHFLPAPLPDHTLQDIATAIGVDTPFFLVGGRARAEGYGERLTPMPDPTPNWIVIAKPNVAGPTAEAYTKLDRLEYAWRDFPSGEELYNDFERVAPCESLELIDALKILGSTDAALTGSGSAVFGLFSCQQAAEAAAAAINAGGLARAWAVHTLTRAESSGQNAAQMTGRKT